MTQFSSPLTTQPTDDLAAIRGPVFAPDDAGYTEELTGFQTGIARQPALVVGAADAGDVQIAVRHARSAGLHVEVQATGHGTMTDGAGSLLISTRRLDTVAVDPRSRTARVGAGARWAQVIDAAAEHGLAPLSGSAPSVGVVGYTLGGGLGLLARQYGYAADHVRSVDLVTPDAERRHVTADSDPDLFWALRGAPASFGIVTALEIDLVPVARFFGGGLTFDLGTTPELLHAYRAWTETVPDELTSSVSMIPFPDQAPFPEPMRGRHIATIHVTYTGDAEEGARLVAPLRALGPLADSVAEMAFADSADVFKDPTDPHAYRGDGYLLSDFDPHAFDQVVDRLRPGAGPMTIAFLHHLGGRLAGPADVPNVVGFRDARFLFRLLGPTDGAALDAVDAVQADVLDAFGTNRLGRRLNFRFGQPVTDAIEATGFEPETYQRLDALRRERGWAH